MTAKEFVKIRYPEAYSVKTNGWILNNPFIIWSGLGGYILKGKDVNENQAWRNLRAIIEKNEKNTGLVIRDCITGAIL